MNKTIKSLLNHRSIRKYKDKPIESKILDLLLEAGNRAPSSGNLQNYSLLILDDKDKLKKIGKVVGAPFIADASICIVSLVDYYRFWRLCDAFDAPFHFDSADSIFIGMWDSLVALHNIAIAAESLGLGTCYIGMILATENQELFDLPEYVFASGMLSIGYPANIPDLRTRLPVETLVHKNSYKIPTDDELKEKYKDWLAKWDNYYEKMSDEKKKHWNEELGVSNNVQYITKTAYTEEIIEDSSKKIFKNIRKAKYRI